MATGGSFIPILLASHGATLLGSATVGGIVGGKKGGAKGAVKGALSNTAYGVAGTVMPTIPLGVGIYMKSKNNVSKRHLNKYYRKENSK